MASLRLGLFEVGDFGRPLGDRVLPGEAVRTGECSGGNDIVSLLSTFLTNTSLISQTSIQSLTTINQQWQLLDKATNPAGTHPFGRLLIIVALLPSSSLARELAIRETAKRSSPAPTHDPSVCLSVGSLLMPKLNCSSSAMCSLLVTIWSLESFVMRRRSHATSTRVFLLLRLKWQKL